MKVIQKTLLAALLAASAGSVMADSDSIDIKVIGQIVPAACKPALSGGATVDYGTIKADTLKADAFTVLESKSLDFSITCDAPAKVALRATDARAGSAVRPVGSSVLGVSVTEATELMGLGQADGKDIGAYGMTISRSVKLDGETTATDAIWSGDSGHTWAKSTLSDTWLGGSGKNIYSWSKSGDLVPVAFKTLSGTLNVQAVINKGAELDLSKAVNLDGLSTIQLYYL